MSTVSINTSELVTKYLNRYCLEYIWNMPYTEYRQNFIARCIYSVPQMGKIDLGAGTITFPDSNAYYVYALPKCCMGNLQIKLTDWVYLDEWLDSNPFDFRVTGTDGQWLWRHGIWIIDHPDISCFLMAINSTMAQKILGTNYNYKKMYLSVYVDSDLNAADLATACICPASVSERDQTWDLCKLANLIFINGREAQPTSAEDIQVGDYVELIDDPDIISDFTINFTKVGEARIYRSSVNPWFNYLVHIPKADNPDNYLITHNTCDIFIRPLNIENAALKGLFVHRFNTTNYITQITHNDFAISEVLLNAYMEVLGTTEVELRVVARRHNKSLKLIREANYLDILYQLSDDEIMDFLAGKGDAALPFWTAAELENQLYIRMMFENPLSGSLTLTQFIQTLGFYNVIAILCKRITRTTIGANTTHTFTVDIPLSLLSTTSFNVFLYVNGFKLDDGYCRAKKTGQYLQLIVDESIDLPTKTDIVVELFENSKLYAEYITPTTVTTSITVSGSYLVFRVREVDDDTSYSNYYADQYTIDQTYEPVEAESGVTVVYTVEENEDGTTTLTFDPSQYGYTFLVTSRRFMGKVYTKQFSLAGLSGRSITTGMLMTTAYQYSDETEITIPVVHDVRTLVYLNGRELVKDLDYCHAVSRTTTGHLVSQAVHVSNAEYLLSSSTNQLDVYATTDPCFTDEYGFLQGTVAQAKNSLMYWYPTLTMVECDGLAMRELLYEDGELFLPAHARNGGVWCTRSIVPQSVYDVMTQYGDDTDTERALAIIEFLRGRRSAADSSDSLQVMEHSHHIYSILVNDIIRSTIKGEFALAYDADLSRMRQQCATFLTAENQDPTMYGVVGNLIVAGAGTLKVNQTYEPVDTSAQGSARRWLNAFNCLCIWYNVEESRWEIVSTLAKVTGVYYYAPDTFKGASDPANLDWVSGDLGEDDPPVVESGTIDLTYIDILPSYRHFEAESAEFYRTLHQLKRALLPEDPIRDIRVDQP